MDGYKKLDPVIQKWIYKQKWDSLREIQERSIDPILSRSTDLVISASTAAGKTEAAFLPALTAMKRDCGIGILYISPLKALINDLYRRLDVLCEMMDIPITAWHGDANVSAKRRLEKNPNGILLITPESLESLLIRKPGWINHAMQGTSYIIIDEYHAFLGFERGVQLQSLMHRLEHLLNRSDKIPRIALSATLGNMDDVLTSLRPNRTFPCKLISSDKNKSDLKMIIRGFINIDDEEKDSTERVIAEELYNQLRGTSNLIFANSRQRTENFAALLTDRCREDGVPNEFFPHHGSLSKEIRASLEYRLQEERLPTTAVATMTLELGIDIGKVNSIAQITAPYSVSSLRQRVGRSGRRGEPAVLRVFISENEIVSNSPIIDKLRLELLQSIAMVKLLIIDKWYEPADLKLCHFSTLLHQILALIAQWGGVQAGQLWDMLCESGIFKNVTVEEFKALLNHMGEKELITQLHSGELILGVAGERAVEHYTFYGVFRLPEEYRVQVAGKTIGSVPIESFLVVKQHIVFNGQRWKVEEVDVDKKVIHVTPAEAGTPPKFCGYGMSVDNLVRREMLKIYCDGVGPLNVLDETAQKLFNEGLKLFNDLNLKRDRVVSHGRHVSIIPWMGDKIVNTLTILLIKAGFKVSSFAGVIEISNADKSAVIETLIGFTDKNITGIELAKAVESKIVEKYDHLLPEPILNREYEVKAFDIEATISWIKKEIA